VHQGSARTLDGNVAKVHNLQRLTDLREGETMPRMCEFLPELMQGKSNADARAVVLRIALKLSRSMPN
jgi:hypothetical protein